MRNAILTVLLLFAGFALVGPAAMAQCKGCNKSKVAKADPVKKDCTDCKIASETKEVCDECEDPVVEKKEAVKQTTYIVKLEGVCCANCAKYITKKLSKLEGVASCSVDTETGKATVKMNEGKTLDQAACEKALKGSDFKVLEFAEEAKAEAKAEPKEDGGCCPECPGCCPKAAPKEEPKKEEPAKPGN